MTGARRTAGISLTCTGAVSALVLSGAPWWVVTAVAGAMTAAGCTVALVQLLVPQDSRDRLEWWRDRRATARRAVAGGRSKGERR
jgi:hypothetical protein